MAEKKQLAKPQDAAPALFTEKDMNLGFEEVDSESLAIPRLVILQQLSPQVEERDDLKAGMIYDTILEVGYDGTEGIRVVPVLYQRRMIEWQPREQGGGFVAEHLPEQAPQGERDGAIWRLPNGNELHDTRQHFVLYETADGWAPALISMTSTQIKKSKRWLTMMKLARAPMFAYIYRLTTVKEQNDKGRWYGWRITREAAVDDPELVAMARELHATLQAGKAQVQYDAGGESEGEVPF